MNTSIEKNICEAVDIIVKKALSEASYDKTIQATVIECVDALTGKYKIRYQDSIFYAYSNNIDTTYNKNASVYVLFPGNDSSKDKTILGTVKNLGINYNVTAEDKDAYETNGTNVISSSSTFGLSSYRKGTYTKVLYHKDYSEEQNLIKINNTSIEQYIKTSKNIKCSAKIRTALELKQQFRGNYGIIFALDFVDNATEELVTKYYTLDVDKMIGNPYKFITETSQYGIFEIDNLNFKEINYISLFTYNFPIIKEEDECIEDIFIRDIELCGVNKLKDDDISNYSLTFITPKGTYFGEGSLETDALSIQAVVRIKNKVLESNTQGLSFYWFSKNAGITSGSQYYNKNGGQGWKCLNQFNKLDEDLVEWISGSDTYTVKKSDVLTKEVDFKCVAIYQDSVISKEFTIKNLVSEYDLSIVSDQGTQFYYDIGTPTLTCLVNGAGRKDYTYSWSVTDNTGTFQSVATTAVLNEEYEDLLMEYEELYVKIKSEEIPLEPNKEKLEELENRLEEFKNITRVDQNQICNLKVNTITNFSIYQCTVYKDDLYLGTASITLVNSFETENGYSLIINEGNKVYKYNESGLSPAHKSLEDPIDIKALTFSLYDNQGFEIDSEILRHCDIEWTVPSSDTMIQIPDSYPVESVDLINETKTYKDILSLSYLIKDRYDYNKIRNTIKLKVNYKDLILTAETNLIFLKEGGNGSNGTELTCTIVPNLLSGQDNVKTPVVTEFKNGSYEWNYTPAATGRYFKVQLWDNEDLIFDNTASGTTTIGKDVIVNWSILRNIYNGSNADPSSFEIDAATGAVSYTGYKEDSPANILKVAVNYDNFTYYATLPIQTVKLYDNKYRLNLKENSGFQYAIYDSKGKNPKYNTVNPFEVIVKRNIGNDIFEDVSQKVTDEYKVSYYWDILGAYYEEKSWISFYGVEEKYASNLEVNQKNYKPVDNFDGLCVTNAVRCTILKDDKPIGETHIPIHLYLNRYENAAINGWDGNRVDINQDGNYILAPQIGAGIKEKDNSFTGVVMGQVKESNKSTSEIGLFGYSKGQRSIFLNSEDGSATFGVNNKGQIILDPSTDKAILKSGNYNTKNKTGMQIDLTTPEIKFGSGNFSVDANGYLVAKGGGSIAGWDISDSALTKDKVGISSSYETDDDYAFWAGGKKAASAPFGVTFGGHLKASTATIGSGSKKINIGKSSKDTNVSAIYTEGKDNFNANSTGFYIGTDGISLGYWNGDNSYFQVDSEGKLIANSGYIGRGRQGWEITSNALVNGNKTTYNDEDNSGVYIGVEGIGLGSSFSVSRSGDLIAKSGNIGGWKLNSTSFSNGQQGDNAIYLSVGSGLKVKSNFSVSASGELTCSNADVSGKITASSGKIGGWTIDASGLTAGSMRIHSNGSISGKNWSINSNGYATFSGSNLSATGAKLSGGSVSGSSVYSGGGYGGGIYTTSDGLLVGNKNIKTYVKDLITDNLYVNNIFEFQGRNVGWSRMVYEIKEIVISKSYAKITYYTKDVLCKDYNSSQSGRLGEHTSLATYSS